MGVQQLETDYLIIGSGAVGMAFADVLLAETDANIVIVDKHHKPGGHWNDAYSFVSLHQPSSFYGVSSTELSSGRKDEIGLNKGLGELASGAEVLAYFDQVMKHVFLPSGRVQYFPMCEYSGHGEFSSLLSKNKYKAKVNKKTVDGTYFNTSVPSTHTPNFEVTDGVELVPLNALPTLLEPRSRYVIVGGGKTGIDAILWLLENQIDPEKITWVMPRDAWWIDRKNTQPSRDFFDDTIGAQAAQVEAIAAAESIDDLFDRLEQSGVLLRLDTNVKPLMFHGATVSQQEVEQLRRITNVIRKGRIEKITQDKIVFANDNIPTPTDALFIDCSARAVSATDICPVFNGKTITVQTVRSYQPVFSAAFIAHIEARYTEENSDNQALKNELCSVVPLPNHDTDWLTGMAAQMQNQFRWSQEPGLKEWLIKNRLDGFTALIQPDEDTTAAQMQILGRLKERVPAAATNIQKLMGELIVREQTAQR